MVKMASSMNHGRVRLATTTSHNMAAIQLILSHAVLDYSIYLWYQICILFQLAAVILRNPLTSSTWPYRGLRFRAHQDHVVFEVAGFCLDLGLMSGWLVEKQGRTARKAVNANPGFKVNQNITFFHIQMFFLLLCFVYMMIIKTQNGRPNNIQKTSPQSFKIQIKILLFPGLVLSCSDQPGPGATLLG